MYVHGYSCIVVEFDVYTVYLLKWLFVDSMDSMDSMYVP